MLAQVTAALEISQEVERFGAYAGLASILGLAILSLLHFGQARELKRLREWAGRAPERAAELQERAAAYEQQVAAAQQAGRTGAAAGAPGTPGAPVRQAGTPLPPRVGPAVPVGAVAAAQGADGGQETQAWDAGNGSVRVAGPVREDGTGPLPAIELPAEAASAAGAPGSAGVGAGAAGAGAAGVGAAGAGAAGTAAAAGAAAAAGGAPPSAVAAGAGSPATAAAGTAPAPRPPASGPGGPPGALPPGTATGSPGAAPGQAGAASGGNGGAPAAPRPLSQAGERPSGAVRVPAGGVVPPPRTAAGAVRARPDGPGGPGGEPRGRGRLLAMVGGGIAALAVAGVLAVTLLGGDDGGTPAAAPAPQGNQLEDPVAPAREEAPTLDRSQFSIRVLNGTTVAGVAGTVNDRLVERDYTAADQPTNAALNNVPTTTVAYTDGNRRAALDVARILEVARENVVQADEGTRVQGGGADVIVTVGADKANE